jgi:hypothetical protein
MPTLPHFLNFLYALALGRPCPVIDIFFNSNNTYKNHVITMIIQSGEMLAWYMAFRIPIIMIGLIYIREEKGEYNFKVY